MEKKASQTSGVVVVVGFWGGGAEMELILIGNVKGWNGIAAVLCILITADNRSPAILKSPIHPLPAPHKWQFIQVAGLLRNLTFHKAIHGLGEGNLHSRVKRGADPAKKEHKERTKTTCRATTSTCVTA